MQGRKAAVVKKGDLPFFLLEHPSDRIKAGPRYGLAYTLCSVGICPLPLRGIDAACLQAVAANLG